MRLSKVALVGLVAMSLTGCSEYSKEIQNTFEMSESLLESQATPKDIKFSMERYNLTRRAYYTNGMIEQSKSVPCPIEKQIGYVALISTGRVVAMHEIDGKVTSLNTYLTPDSIYVDNGKYIPDVDGSFGENPEGIFFFDLDGEMYEWSGAYYYSHVPIELNGVDTLIK